MLFVDLLRVGFFLELVRYLLVSGVYRLPCRSCAMKRRYGWQIRLRDHGIVLRIRAKLIIEIWVGALLEVLGVVFIVLSWAFYYSKEFHAVVERLF